MRSVTFVLPLLLVACAPAVPVVEVSPTEMQAIEAALEANFWPQNHPHSACGFRALSREEEKFYVYYNCQHWYKEAGEWNMSGDLGPAVVSLGTAPMVKRPQDGGLSRKDVQELFPADVRAFALGGGPEDFYRQLNAEAEARAKAVP